MSSSDPVGEWKPSPRWSLKSQEYLSRRRQALLSSPNGRFNPFPPPRPSPSPGNHTTGTEDRIPAAHARSAASNGTPPQQPPGPQATRGELALDAPAPLWDRIRAQLTHFLSDQVTPIRLASHVAVLAVALVVLFVSRMELPEWQLSLSDLPQRSVLFANVMGQPIPAAELTDPLSADEVAEAFRRAVVLSGAPDMASEPMAAPAPAQETQPVGNSQVSTPRTSIEVYTVQSGDTVLGIARKFGLKPDTILWANPALERNPDLLRIGDRLIILPVDGVLHVVQPGDTLSSIAAKYKVTPQEIAEYPLNGLESVDTPLTVGKQLVVPRGQKPYVPQQVLAYDGPVPEGASEGSGVFAWPTSGIITQPFWNGHRAIDIAAREATPVLAADSGYVVLARSGGWNWGYGNVVMIDHQNGYLTVYAHMKGIYVRQGEQVAKGQQIGIVGNTGNSTGPHLHFEIRYRKVNRNPLSYLP